MPLSRKETDKKQDRKETDKKQDRTHPSVSESEVITCTQSTASPGVVTAACALAGYSCNP